MGKYKDVTQVGLHAVGLVGKKYTSLGEKASTRSQECSLKKRELAHVSSQLDRFKLLLLRLRTRTTVQG